MKLLSYQWISAFCLELTLRKQKNLFTLHLLSFMMKKEGEN
ncbi:hypothetical protein NT05LI_1025 [Listeria ivanovii FSL F6-596]|nr:hypothetical protein NT05LI_1025 [Listeria ivanovii FSL F6-596]